MRMNNSKTHVTIVGWTVFLVYDGLKVNLTGDWPVVAAYSAQLTSRLLIE